jgi:hypothetical protein
MFDNILNAANLYADGVKTVQDRRAQWIQKHDEIKKHLTEVATFLNGNAAYKQGFFVDDLHAFNEENNGTCADMPSLTFRSGEMPMLVMFRNSMGEKKEYHEKGFQISFMPTITGQVIVLLYPHQSDLSKPATPYTTLAIVDEPGNITLDVIDEIIAKGIEMAYYTSFTGMGTQTATEEEQEQPAQAPHAHSPIGFKRYETTEKPK